MEGLENRPSSIRPPGRTNLPLLSNVVKASLNELTDSQSNSRLAAPQSIANLLKHKSSEIAEPPAKQRKCNDSILIKRPTSSQSNMVPRLLPQPSTKFTASTTANRNGASTNSFLSRPKSYISTQSSKLHNRSKSQVSTKLLDTPLEQGAPTSNEHTVPPNKHDKRPISKIPCLSPPKVSKPALLSASINRLRPRKKSPNRLVGPPSPIKTVFLSKESSLTRSDWEGNGVENRISAMEGMFHALRGQMDGTSFERGSMKELIDMMKTRIGELEMIRERHENTISTIRCEKDELYEKYRQQDFDMKKMLHGHEIELDDIKREQRRSEDDLQRMHRLELERLRETAEQDIKSTQHELESRVTALKAEHQDQLSRMQKEHVSTLKNEQRDRKQQIAELEAQREAHLKQIASSAGEQERENDGFRKQLGRLQTKLDQEVSQREAEQHDYEKQIKAIRQSIETKSLEISRYEAQMRDQKDKINFLQSSEQEQNKKFEQLDQGAKQAYQERDEMVDKMRKYEEEVRKLRNRVLELKGNIRVFCRVRPLVESETDAAKIGFPDEGGENSQIEVTGIDSKSCLGKDTTKRYHFTFDKVFGPNFSNSEIFDEVRELVQSSLDGYNCCIFSYGQTGAGKTYLMSSHSDGIIPLAVDQIYRHTKELEKLGWSYSMSGSFVEVYNEHLNDLLGQQSDLDNKKLKIQYDKKMQCTAIIGANVVSLDSPESVHEVLKKADKFRSVAATKANARSSRSHSVFILRLVGNNSKTNESCVGTLNLVDLAGSERLSQSKAEGDRLKETQNINRSLSALGDVIAALGKGESHIPYANSTLTRLLQFSLGGNSKTLMFVMVSPLQAHLEQTLTSLRFAQKVNSTHIGTAKKQLSKT